VPQLPAVKALEKRLRNPTSSGDAPTTSGKAGAQERFKLGDVAFSEGKYDLALRRYLEEGRMDESLQGISPALLRAYFATGDFKMAATHLMTVLDSAKVTDVEKARAFSTGVVAAYPVSKPDFSRHLDALAAFAAANPVSQDVWFLQGILEIEGGRAASAVKTLATYQSISATPRKETAFFTQVAQARAR